MGRSHAGLNCVIGCSRVRSAVLDSCGVDTAMRIIYRPGGESKWLSTGKAGLVEVIHSVRIWAGLPGGHAARYSYVYWR